MAKEKIVLCDTNILIKLLRSDVEMKKNLEKIGRGRLAVCIVNHAEILYGTKKRDFESTKKFLGLFKTYHITEEASKIFNGLIVNYTISHRVQLADTLIAAIAIANNLLVYTENTKHFDFIPELKLYKP